MDIVVSPLNKPVERIKVDNPEHIEQPLIESVVQTLLGKDNCPSTAESAARTNWVMDEVLNDYRVQN